MSNITQHPSAAPSLIDIPKFEDRPTTPIVKRISSIRLPHDHSAKDLSELSPLLNFDLDGQIIDAVPDLLNTLFPDNILPFAVNRELLDSLSSSIYDAKTYRWKIGKEQTEKVSRSFITEHCRYSQTHRHTVAS